MEAKKILFCTMNKITTEEEPNLTSKKDQKFWRNKPMIKCSAQMSAACQEQQDSIKNHIFWKQPRPEQNQYHSHLLLNRALTIKI